MKKEIKKLDFFKDPVQGEIQFYKDDQWILELINSKNFQRLNRIHQLGENILNYPSASHTRFSHALGVYEVTRRFIETLEIPTINDTQRKIILSAALLHDVGHGPNSHSFEAYTGISHEAYTKAIITDPNGEIFKILIKNGVDPKEVAKVIDKSSQFKWMNNLISSQIDADRIDYLQRDSHYTGATYGINDAEFIAKRTMYVNGEIVYSSKCLSTIESFLIGRNHMYNQVYNDKRSLLYTWIISSILNRVKELYKERYSFVDFNNLIYLIKPWLEDRNFTLEEFYLLDDYSLHMLIISLGHEKDYVILKMLEAYIKPSIYTIEKFDEKTFKHLTRKIKNNKIDNKYLLTVINSDPVCVYDKNKQPIMILNEVNNQIIELSQISPIINSIVNSKKDNNPIYKYMIIRNNI